MTFLDTMSSCCKLRVVDDICPFALCNLLQQVWALGLDELDRPWSVSAARCTASPN